MHWQFLFGLLLANLASRTHAAETATPPAPDLIVSGSSRELPFRTAPASENMEHRAPLQCRQTAMLNDLRNDPAVVAALSRELSGRVSFVLGASQGERAAKHTSAALEHVWKTATVKPFANCVAQCFALSPSEKPMSLDFTSDGWRSMCGRVPGEAHATLEFAQLSCGLDAEWRQVLVQRADRGSGGWVICATLATWGDTADRDYRMRVRHLPPADPTIAETSE